MSKDDSRLALSQVAGPLADLMQKLDGPKGEETLARLKLMLRGEFLGWESIPTFDSGYSLRFGGQTASEIRKDLRGMGVVSRSLRGPDDMLDITVRTDSAREVELVAVEPETIGLSPHSSLVSALHTRARQLNMALPPSDAVFAFACLNARRPVPLVFADVRILGWGNRANVTVRSGAWYTEVIWEPVTSFTRLDKCKYMLMRIPQE